MYSTDVLYSSACLSSSPLCCSLPDVWWEAVGSDVMDHAHLCGLVHIWGGQRLPFHILSVSPSLPSSIYPFICPSMICSYKDFYFVLNLKPSHPAVFSTSKTRCLSVCLLFFICFPPLKVIALWITVCLDCARFVQAVLRGCTWRPSAQPAGYDSCEALHPYSSSALYGEFHTSYISYTVAVLLKPWMLN